MRDYSADPRPYELMTIFTPDVTDENVLDELETVAEYLRTAGGTVFEVLHEAPWGRRRFAYPIRHAGRDVREGFYSVFEFDALPGQIAEIERDLKLDEHVLRFLLTVKDLHEGKAAQPESEAEAVEEAVVAETRGTPIAAGDVKRNVEAARAAAEAEAEIRAAQQAASASTPRDGGGAAAQRGADRAHRAPAPSQAPAPTESAPPAAEGVPAPTENASTSPEGASGSESIEASGTTGESAGSAPITSDTPSDGAAATASQDSADATGNEPDGGEARG